VNRDYFQCNSLIEPIIERAKKDPERTAIVFMEEDGTKETISAYQFYTNMMNYARMIQELRMEPGSIIPLVFPHSKELLFAFFGAMVAGAVPAILTYLTQKMDSASYYARLQSMIERYNVHALITSPLFQKDLTTLLAPVGCRVSSSEDLQNHEIAGETYFPEEYPSGEQIAFLQHSSGTTGIQKGVTLSHRAVLNQIQALRQALDIRPDDVMVDWLPMYHDGGLIGSMMVSAVMGLPLVFLSPFAWLRSPKILYWAIHEYKGTITWMPNFALNYSVHRIQEKDLEGLDLNHWRVLVVGAEPVLHESLQMFSDRFSPYGFQETAFVVCQGMAENTLAMTMTPVDQAPNIHWINIKELQQKQLAAPMPERSSDSMPVVSCGVPVHGAEIRIVNDDGSLLPERRVGEIITRTNCMFDGYYKRPDLTAKTLRDGWYYTGDIGYMDQGELYVCGRKSDVIIVGGRNIYPHDIEAMANRVSGVYPGRVVAFGVPDESLGTEKVVLVCELKSGADDGDKLRIEREVRRRTAQELDVTLAVIHLLDHRWVVKSSSGKIARNANRKKYLNSLAHQGSADDGGAVP